MGFGASVKGLYYHIPFNLEIIKQYVHILCTITNWFDETHVQINSIFIQLSLGAAVLTFEVKTDLTLLIPQSEIQLKGAFQSNYPPATWKF